MIHGLGRYQFIRMKNCYSNIFIHQEKTGHFRNSRSDRCGSYHSCSVDNEWKSKLVFRRSLIPNMGMGIVFGYMTGNVEINETILLCLVRHHNHNHEDIMRAKCYAAIRHIPCFPHKTETKIVWNIKFSWMRPLSMARSQARLQPNISIKCKNKWRATW